MDRYGIGHFVRNAWKTLSSSKRVEIYIDINAAQNLHLVKPLTEIRKWLGLKFVFLTDTSDKISEVRADLIIDTVTDTAATWKNEDSQKIRWTRIPSLSAECPPYLRALLGIAMSSRSLVLVSTEGPNPPLRDYLAVDSSELFFVVLRPLIMERDILSGLPGATSAHQKEIDKTNISGWLDYSILLAAKRCLFPFQEIWETLILKPVYLPDGVFNRDKKTLLNILQGLWTRFEYLLRCRNEIDWLTYSSKNTRGDPIYHFDHLVLLSTAMLDQLASLCLFITNRKAEGFGVSLCPSRSKSGASKAITAAIHEFGPTTEAKMNSERTMNFLRFIYSLRNQIAHRLPSSGHRYSGFHDRPQAKMIPLKDAEILGHGRAYLASGHKLATEAFSLEWEPVLDPLVASWLIVSEIAEISRACFIELWERIKTETQGGRTKGPGYLTWDEELDEAASLFLGIWEEGPNTALNLTITHGAPAG